jgi:hypothetical protein
MMGTWKQISNRKCLLFPFLTKETHHGNDPCHQARTKLKDEKQRWFSEQIKLTLEVVLG